MKHKKFRRMVWVVRPAPRKGEEPGVMYESDGRTATVVCFKSESRGRQWLKSIDSHPSSHTLERMSRARVFELEEKLNARYRTEHHKRIVRAEKLVAKKAAEFLANKNRPRLRKKKARR